MELSQFLKNYDYLDFCHFDKICCFSRESQKLQTRQENAQFQFCSFEFFSKLLTLTSFCKQKSLKARVRKDTFYTFNYYKVYLFPSPGLKKLSQPKILGENLSYKMVHTAFFYLLSGSIFRSFNAWIARHHNLGRKSVLEEHKTRVKLNYHGFRLIINWQLSPTNLAYLSIYSIKICKSGLKWQKKRVWKFLNIGPIFTGEKKAVSNFQKKCFTNS